jgi:hypothetical protein
MAQSAGLNPGGWRHELAVMPRVKDLTTAFAVKTPTVRSGPIQLKIIRPHVAADLHFLG